MPGTLTFGRPKSAACTMCCPTARSCPSAPTIPCTVLDTWSSVESCTGEPGILRASVRADGLSGAPRLCGHASVQYGHTRVLYPGPALDCSPSASAGGPLASGGQRDGRPVRCCHAVLHLHCRAAVP